MEYPEDSSVTEEEWKKLVKWVEGRMVESSRFRPLRPIYETQLAENGCTKTSEFLIILDEKFGTRLGACDRVDNVFEVKGEVASKVTPYYTDPPDLVGEDAHTSYQRYVLSSDEDDFGRVGHPVREAAKAARGYCLNARSVDDRNVPVFRMPGASAGVYLIFDTNGSLMYVGESKAVHKRCYQHTSRTAWRRKCDDIPSFEWYTYIPLNGRPARRVLEGALIQALRPPENTSKGKKVTRRERGFLGPALVELCDTLGISTRFGGAQ